MDWATLGAKHPEVLAGAFGFAGGAIGGALTFVSTWRGTGLSFRAEVMKLRQAIALRRVQEFDQAANAFRGLLLWLCIPTTGEAELLEHMQRFCVEGMTAMARLVTAMDLALTEEHGKILGQVVEPLASRCTALTRLCKTCLDPCVEPPEDWSVQYVLEATEALRIVVRMMEAVDISAEEAVEGRSLWSLPSWRRRQRIKAMVKGLTEAEGERPRPASPPVRGER